MSYVKTKLQLKCFLDLDPNINFDENENKQIFPENMSNKIISRDTVTSSCFCQSLLKRNFSSLA